MLKEIDYGELLKRARIMHRDILVVSPSKRELVTRITPTEVMIEDKGNNSYYMRAFNSGGILELELRTIIEGRKHPDMNGAGFVDFSLKHFQNSPFPVRACLATLVDGTSSYAKFASIYKPESQNEVEAVKATWWGKTFNKTGFTKITSENIEIRKANPEAEFPHAHVIAIFSKPIV